MKARNFPIYENKTSNFFNLIKYIIFRNINPIALGVYRTNSLIELFRYYNYFDKSNSNHDNLFMINFLLNKKVGVIKKIYFQFFKKNRNKIEKIRNSGPIYWKRSSLFMIFVYQFNFLREVIKSITKSNKLNFIEKQLLYCLLVLSYFQKTFSYIAKYKFT